MIVPPKSGARAQRDPLEGLVFATLWATGPDPAMDGIFRIAALRRSSDAGSWETFDRFCDPFDREGGEHASASARMVREYGVDRDVIEGAPHASEIWDEFRDFVGSGAVVAPDAEVFTAWCEHFAGRRGSAPSCIAPCDLAALFLPGRLASRRAGLVAAFTHADPVAYGPIDLHAALLELARRVHALEDDVLRIAVQGYRRVWSGLLEHDAAAAARLQLAFALLDRASAWSQGFELPLNDLRDGRIVALGRDETPVEERLEDLLPRYALEVQASSDDEKLPPDREGDLLFEPEDLATLDAIFQVHLPARKPRPGDAGTTYRPSQHQVAREIARSLGSKELLLIHAPTGTGKTLAYLVPAMLWAKRHCARIGIATYTRALQEQAMDREVPRALGLLAAAGITTPTRVTVLKGRDNYVCWRALKHSTPEEDTPETWLAWTYLATFALTDTEGDLDRLPLRPPLALDTPEPFDRALQTLARGVRGMTSCCSHRDDMRTCAAEVVRDRAERSHVVIVNQAFALSRPEFFKHMVFDECEHLHDQAHSAWSAELTFREMRGVLTVLRQPTRHHSRALLDRLKRALVPDTPSGEALQQALVVWEELARAIDVLEDATRAFETWRERELEARVDREEHSLMREYVLEHDSIALVEARREVVSRGCALDGLLGKLVEYVDQLHLRSAGSLRRAFDRARIDLNGMVTVINTWIPIEENETRFRPSTFYDVERDQRGELTLAARVLLPHEFLGRNYYPALHTGVFLSATTWLQDGFGAARAYLGLDRAEHPAEDEVREPCRVRTFRAPDVFDYRRVLIAIPRDAPQIGADKERFLEYVRRFVTYLGERTRGRMLVLFTNSVDLKRTGEDCAGFFRARRIPLWFQNMQGSAKEELSDLFRSTVDSILFGVDTFWYGADFPGETLEYLVIVRLPYGVPDRYHHAQCAAIGVNEQRRQIYLPRALAKFRQGFGRLMRRESDRGCVFVLDARISDPRHRMFLRELPIERGFDAGTSPKPETSGARLVRGDTDHCIHEALAHMNLLADVKRRGLDQSFSHPNRTLRGQADAAEADLPRAAAAETGASEFQPPPPPVRKRPPPATPFDIPHEDLPF